MRSIVYALSFLSIFTSVFADDFDSTCDENHEKVVYFHHINYVLPFYRSSNVNATALPDGLMGSVKNQEFKGQISLKAPLIRNIIDDKLSLYIAYTQLSYWQIYVSSPYFRDTNYRPEAFLAYKPTEHWRVHVGIDHESNGRGNHLERSWNRGYLQIQYQNNSWRVTLKPWTPLFESSSIEVHNPDIVHFLGRSHASIGYQSNGFATFIEATNLESGLKRGHQVLHINFKVKPYLYLYLQGFNGYGQSLIDYNRRSTGFGIGLAINSGMEK